MQPINLRDYERLAEARLDPAVWAYYAGGADDELTLKENEDAFGRFWLRPRVLADVSTVSLATTVLGSHVSMPILVAPTAGQGMAHAEGECATARAAADAGTIMIASSSASRSLEEIARSCRGTRWFQLYVRFWDEAERLVKDSEANGFSAIVLTVDLPRMGNRERDHRAGFKGRQFRIPNYTDRQEGYQSPSLTWDSLARVRGWSRLPLVLKGIVTAEDAVLALENGAEAIIVSNHGGRQLDGVIPTIEALPEVVQSVGKQCEIYLDGGIRRGTDVLKALAFGASAVLIGRPILWGLAVDGETGVRNVLEILRVELDLALALSGCSALSEVNPQLVKRKIHASTL